MTMPPQPLVYEGHEAIAAFLDDRFATHRDRRVRLVPTRANSQPAFGHYIDDAHAAPPLIGGAVLRPARAAALFLDGAAKGVPPETSCRCAMLVPRRSP